MRNNLCFSDSWPPGAPGQHWSQSGGKQQVIEEHIYTKKCTLLFNKIHSGSGF